MSDINYKNELWPLIYDQFNGGSSHKKEHEFYKKIIKNNGKRVLEVACGTGLHFLKFFKEGIDIHGFDISPQMLDFLLKKADKKGLKGVKNRVSKQNMIDFNYENKFDIIFIPARSFLHLIEQENQIFCLKNIYRHLTNNGKFVLNFFNPDLKKLIEYSSDKFKFINSFNHPERDSIIKLYSRQKNDIANQIQNIEWKFKIEDSEYLTRMKVRWIYKEEFKLLLKLAGFKSWDLFGDFKGSDFKNESSEMLWVVNK